MAKHEARDSGASMKWPWISRARAEARYLALRERTDARVEDYRRLVDFLDEAVKSADARAREADARADKALHEAGALLKRAADVIVGPDPGTIATPATIGENDRKAVLAERKAAIERRKVVEG